MAAEGSFGPCCSSERALCLWATEKASRAGVGEVVEVLHGDQTGP